MLDLDIRFRYESGFSLALRLTLDDGVTALVGPSGSGKTTTLHLIAGLLRPSSGRIAWGEKVWFDSKVMRNVPPEQREVGLVFQDYQLFPHRTVEDNLRYGLVRTAKPKFDLKHAVEILELGPLLHRYPLSLSGGERQRVALGRAVLRSPALLLLDEPLSALDQDLRESTAQWLQKLLNEYRLPTLLVTHDAECVRSLATRSIQMEQVKKRD